MNNAPIKILGCIFWYKSACISRRNIHRSRISGSWGTQYSTLLDTVNVFIRVITAIYTGPNYISRDTLANIEWSL